jgi:hypothetical protein
MNHYTNADGFKRISSQVVWRFVATKPPGLHPIGAYFTTLDIRSPNLCARLRIPRTKIEYVFCFTGTDGLRSLSGGRGEYVFWCPADYEVDRPRQMYNGLSETMP